MANPQYTPHYQNDHIPSSSDAPNQFTQWQTAAQQSAYTATQGCSCSWCSAARHDNPLVWRTMEHQNPWPPGDQAVPFANQFLVGADNPMAIAAMPNAQPQAQFVAPQVYDATGYIALHDGARSPLAQTNAGLDQTQILDMTATDNLRRLAWRFVNNPQSLVNVVRLEPSISGRFRVVIILEVADIL